jgi:tetratricopeptide (TPR) repeat protein
VAEGAGRGAGTLPGIEAEQPGLWDVRQQIAALDGAVQLAGYLAEGAAAYQSGDWAGVISAYEAALALDPPWRIRRSKNTCCGRISARRSASWSGTRSPIEDLEAAEGFYLTALELLPQVDANPGEFTRLQETARDLLAEKFALNAARAVADVNQTATSLAQAVGFMRRAVNLLPADPDLRQNLVTQKATCWATSTSSVRTGPAPSPAWNPWSKRPDLCRRQCRRAAV